MMRFFLLLIFTGSFCLSSCHHEEEVEFSANNCKRTPPFVLKMGFDKTRTGFSTSDSAKMGLLLIELPASSNMPPKIYQHPSWTQGGWLAPIMVDDEGNIFTAPAPFINVLYNPANNQNTIYKVDGNTGEMAEFMRLPFTDSSIQNPFGIIGMAYLCETNTLYVSTIAGSNRQFERGVIYAIDTKEKKIIDNIPGTDAMGMGITYITGQRTLLFGNGRNSDVSTVTIDKAGKFSSKPELAFSLQGMGIRGDDKVRRINTDKYGNLDVIGMEFNFNLIAPREKQESYYTATYLPDEKKWQVSVKTK